MGKPFAIPPWGAVATTGPMIEIDPASDKAGLPPAPYVEFVMGRSSLDPGGVSTSGPMIEIDPASDKARLPPAPTPPGGGDAAPPG